MEEEPASQKTLLSIRKAGSLGWGMALSLINITTTVDIVGLSFGCC